VLWLVVNKAFFFLWTANIVSVKRTLEHSVFLCKEICSKPLQTRICLCTPTTIAANCLRSTESLNISSLLNMIWHSTRYRELSYFSRILTYPISSTSPLSSATLLRCYHVKFNEDFYFFLSFFNYLPYINVKMCMVL
jgi:hypothetical protein